MVRVHDKQDIEQIQLHAESDRQDEMRGKYLQCRLHERFEREEPARLLIRAVLELEDVLDGAAKRFVLFPVSNLRTSSAIDLACDILTCKRHMRSTS